MYKKIMVPLDGSKLAECAFPQVEAIASGCLSNMVVLVRVVEPRELPANLGTFINEKAWQKIESDRKAAAKEYLDRVSKELKFKNLQLQTRVLVGKIAESLADFTDKNEIDLIIMATHGRSGVSRWVLGSVAEKILHSSCVPILLVRAPGCVPGI